MKAKPELTFETIKRIAELNKGIMSLLLIMCLTLLTLSGCKSNTAISNDTSIEATEIEQTTDADENTVKEYPVDWSDISADGLNEESFIRKMDIEVLEEVAGKLQSVVEEACEEEKKNPEIAITEGFPRVLKKEKFLEVLNMGDKAQMPLYFILYKSENNGMYEYLCAYALCQLSGIASMDESKGYSEWSNAKEFLELFNEYVIENQSK